MLLVALLVFRAPRVLRRAGLLGVPVGGGPPAGSPRRSLLLVASLVFRAPSGPAARESATRDLRSEWSFSEPARTLRRPPRRRRLRCRGVAWCVGSKPGQAPPPPSIPMVMGVWQHEELSVSVQGGVSRS